MPTPNIPDFRLIKPIGEGGVGEIWMGLDLLENYRAIKIIRQNQFKRLEDYQAEFRGIRKYAPLSQNHAGLIEIYHAGIRNEEGFYYYIMSLADDLEHGAKINPEHYQPKTLRTYLDFLDGRIPLEEAKQIAVEITTALNDLHGAGLVHRDIKPDNILCVEGRWELADIGFVSSVGSSSQVGTIGYIAPEGPGKPTADILSLGRVLYEISSGKDVSDCPDYPSWVFDSPDHREKFRKFNDIILKATDPIPKNRFKNAAEMLESLRKINHQDTNAQKETKLKTSIPYIYIGALILIVGFVGYFSRQITNTLEPVSPQQPMPKEKTSEALPTNPADEETPSNTKPNTQEVKEAIEAAIRLSIKKPTGELTSADIENVRIIDLRSKQLTDLKFLAKLTQLESLMLFDSGIAEVSPLQGLRRLTHLNLHRNKISNISPLSGLTGLQHLFLDDNKLIDITTLKELKQLEELSLAINSITDVGALKELKQLRLLDLRDNPNLTKANIAKLQKELPMCRITHNATTTVLPSRNLPSNLSLGLVAYYPFNGNAKDESGNGHHGYERRFIDGEWTNPAFAYCMDRLGKQNRAFQALDQKGQFIELPHQLFDGVKSSGTVSLWFRRSNKSPGDLFTSLHGPSYKGVAIEIDKEFQLKASIGYLHSTAIGKPYQTENNTWHHALLIWRNSKNNAELFVDGKSAGKNIKTYSGAGPSSRIGLGVVRSSMKLQEAKGFNIQLDDLRIYDRALLPAEVEALHKHENSRGIDYTLPKTEAEKP